jgi:peptidoglycan hydrolase-like protein with peptidoglycan-binding domain
MKLARILKVGVSGDDVKYLQERLTKLGFYNAQITGNYGPKTEASVKAFQSNKGLNADGVVGMASWAILSDDNTAPKPLVSVSTNSEVKVEIREVIKEVIKEVPVIKETGTITLERLKDSVKALGYIWYEDRPNIIGVRTNIDVPDVFNDFIFLIYKENDVEIMKTYLVTTNPGVYWLKNPLSVKGTALLKPGQWINSHSIGFHQSKKDHVALVQRGTLTVYRDNDRDSLGEEVVDTESGNFGINIHGANKAVKTTKIGKFSAGCQVFAVWEDKEEFISILQNYKELTGNKFTYTLLRENEII